MNNAPLVSISCLTYNHGQFIRKCLDGFLMQKTNFQYEVLVHDDASTDNTRAIIEEYAQKHPDIIFPLFQEENQYQKGVRGMMAKFNFPRARGKYIALCEGDDYWTDPLKLQKQVDFLEHNSDYVLCFHKSMVLQDEELLPDPLEERYNRIKKYPVTKMDLLEQSNFMHTNSVVFRNSWKENPIELNYSPAGDYLMHILVAEHGKIHRIDEVMGVYRMGSGVYSTLDSFNLRKQKLKLDICIVSMLQDSAEKEVVLRKIIQSLDRMKNPLAEANRFDSLKDIVSMKLMTRIVAYRLKRIFRKRP
jgi:glycosyltransferase involved in cell wall biosynthesis